MKHSKLQLQVVLSNTFKLVDNMKLPGAQPLQGVYEGCQAKARL